MARLQRLPKIFFKESVMYQKLNAKQTSLALPGWIALWAAVPVSAQVDVTIRIWALTNPNYPEFIAGAAEALKAIHPNVTIAFQESPNKACTTAMQVALIGSELPDLFFNRADKDSWRLLRDGSVLDKADLAMAPVQFGTSLAQRWLDMFNMDNRGFGASTDAVTTYCYCDNAVFADTSLLAPATFTERLGLCTAIRAIDPEIVPIPLGNSERWQMNERVMGDNALRADHSRTAADDVLFTDPGYETACGKVPEMHAAGSFQDAPNATSPEISRPMFSSQIAPMIFCGPWCMRIFDGEGDAGRARFRFPPVEGEARYGNSNLVAPPGLPVAAAAQHRQESVAWISFLTSPKQSAKFAEMGRALPYDLLIFGRITTTDQFKWVDADMASLAVWFNVIDVDVEAGAGAGAGALTTNAYRDAQVKTVNGTMPPQQAMESIRPKACHDDPTGGWVLGGNIRVNKSLGPETLLCLDGGNLRAFDIESHKGVFRGPPHPPDYRPTGLAAVDRGQP